MRPTATLAAWSVCMLVTAKSCAKTAESNEMPTAGCKLGSAPRNDALDGASSSPGERKFGGHTLAHLKAQYREYPDSEVTCGLMTRPATLSSSAIAWSNSTDFSSSSSSSIGNIRRLSQGYSVGGSSDAAARCQYCGNLFMLWYTGVGVGINGATIFPSGVR